MTDPKDTLDLHPIAALDHVIDSYRDFLQTEFRAKDEHLREALEQALDRRGFLAGETFFSASRPYKKGVPWKDLPLDTQLAEAMRKRSKSPTSFAHQSEAITHLAGAQPSPLVITTGTGSGKTEAFLLPVLQAAIADSVATKNRAGLTAILLYPMNALANDQRERIQEMLEASGWAGAISVAMYNQATSQDERQRMRENPPHLLLTNYQMLEYLLVRPADREALFKGHRTRFLVLDEVHSYRGTLGTHVALLVRRLKAHLRSANPNALALLPVGASATIRSGGDETSREQAVQGFFGRLAGIPDSSSIKVVFEHPEEIVIPEAATLPAVLPPDDEKLTSDHRLLWLLGIWLGERAMSLPELVVKVKAEVPERAAWSNEDVRRELEWVLRQGGELPDEVPGALRLRVHRFVRGGWEFHRCIDPECGKLYPKGEERCECGKRTAPLYLCRDCGADFLRMKATVDEGGGNLEPFQRGEFDEGEAEWLLYYPERWTVHTETEEDEEGTSGYIEEAKGKKKKKREPIHGSIDLDELAFDGDPEANPVRASLFPTRQTCPACGAPGRSRNAITKVFLGTSAALKVLSEGTMEALPERPEDPKKRLLIFCDSRQDAAHQARFIDSATRFDRMRSRVTRLLTDHGSMRIQEMVERLGGLADEHHDNPYLPEIGRARGEELEKLRAWEEAPLLEDLSINARFRNSLENLGLVRVGYEEIEQELSGDDKLADALGVPVDRVAYAATRFLDVLRRRGALHRDLLRYNPFGNMMPDKLRAARWERQYSHPVGLAKIGPYPAIKWDNDKLGRLSNGLQVQSLSNRSAPAKMLRHLAQRFSGITVSEEAIQLLIRKLAELQYLKADKCFGSRGRAADLFQVNDGLMILSLADEGNRLKCDVCGVVSSWPVPTVPCFRCRGVLRTFTDEEVQRSRYARRAASESPVVLSAREHTAQIPTDRRSVFEEQFKGKDSPLNVLACSPTLEMGIDVGGLEAVLMRNVPPRPDNYAQRGGRAGRRRRVGMVIGYSRAVPHDQYFFDNPAEMIAGEVPAPTFNLGNVDVIRRHLYAVAFGQAEPGLSSRMAEYVNFEGKVNAERVDELVAGLLAVHEEAAHTADLAFSEDVLPEAGVEAAQLVTWLEELEPGVRDAFNRTAFQVQQLRAALDVLYTTGEKQREANRMVALINKLLGTDKKDGGRQSGSAAAYPLRRLAEFGLLPGYEFPPEPATIRLLGDQDEEALISVAREFGLRQYQPGAPVYARGRRWRVFGVDTSSPYNPQTTEAGWRYQRCRACGLVFDPKDRGGVCPRCENAEPQQERTAMAYGGFLGVPWEGAILDEEERKSSRDNVEIHPAWDAVRSGIWQLPNGWRLEWRRGEKVRWVNEGPRDPQDKEIRKRYALCPDCGKLLKEPKPKKGKKAGNKAPADGKREDEYGHGPNCPRRGQPADHLALYHEGRVETLRLLAPLPGGKADLEKVTGWAWTLGYALLSGARRHLALADNDLDVLFEGARDVKRGERTFTQMVLTFVDPNIGGSGYLRRFVEELPEIALATLQHLDHPDCDSACYRCLKSYRNQRHHSLLSWPSVVSTLEELTESELAEVPLAKADNDDPTPWLEAYAAGCQSPLEHTFLKLMEKAGLQPTKQHPISRVPGGKVFTVTDFAFLEKRVAIYVDGAAYHRGETLRRDRAIEETLTTMEPPWTVVRWRAKQLSGWSSLLEDVRAKIAR
jgi:ATP-dependent helicase YprA (DUF1998 family)